MKIALFSITSMSIFLLAGCTNSNQSIEGNSEEMETSLSEVTDDTSEIGVISADLEVFEFDEALAKADLIAHVEVVEMMEEVNDPSPKTIFRADVIESLKGQSELSEIVVLQQGNSHSIFHDNALFEPGENYILFMMETRGLDLEESYYILGEETGMYKLIDQSTAVKLSLKDEQLKEIEKTDTNNSMLEEKTRYERQILHQDKLKELISNFE